MEDYSLVKQIGKGSYGKIWLVKKNNSNKQYVLKQIDMHNASKQQQCSAYIEVKLLSSLKHPNIVTYYNSFQNPDGILYIILGYCENGDLYTYIRSRKGLLFPEKQIVEWFVQICMALQYLHERNILHRDLKTQNIFLTKTKIIKVGDLGIARVLDSARDLATTLIGTPYYMSPELFANQPYNHKSDVWALGCCVYEMASLQHAFNAKDLNSLAYKVLQRELPTMPKQYSAELVELMHLMLSYDAVCRPTVKCILQNDYVRRHIMDFLKESSSRYKKSSNRLEKCSSPVPKYPTHERNIESEDEGPKQCYSAQSKLVSPVVSKDSKIPIAQATSESLNSDKNQISSRTCFVTNKKHQVENTENVPNDEKSKIFIDGEVNNSEHIFKNFITNSNLLDIKSSIPNKPYDERNSFVTSDKDTSLHQNSAQDSEIDKATIVPSRRRQHWQKPYLESNTASNNECNKSRKRTIPSRPLPTVPSQPVVDPIKVERVVFCKGEHGNIQKPNLQKNEFFVQEKILKVNSQDTCIMSTQNFEARRRRREKLQQQHSTEPTLKIHTNSEYKQKESCNNLHNAKQEEMENKEKSDAEFQEFIEMLNDTLKMKDKNSKQQYLMSKEESYGNKISKTTVEAFTSAS